MFKMSNHPNFRAIHHQTLAEIPICLGEFSMGIAFGWLAPMIRDILDDPKSEISANEDQCSWLASLLEFGRAFSPLLTLLLLDILGRKIMLQISSTIFFAIWLIITFTRSIVTLCVTFFFFGLGIGIFNAASAVYIGENSSPNLRGIFCSACTTAFYISALIQYIISGYLPYRVLAITNLIMALVCLTSTLLYVESAQFLILRGRFEKAEKNMMWLKGTVDKEDIATEFEAIKANIESEKEKKTSYKELLKAPANYKSLLIVLILNMAHASTGNAALFTYISIIFPPNKFFTWYQVTVYFGISQMTFSLLASVVIEKYNRRTLTLFSFTMFLLCHSTAAYFFYDADHNSSPIRFGVWVIFGSVCTFSGCSAVLDSVMHMLRGELFPQSIKPIGTGLTVVARSLMEFVTIKIFLMIRSQYGTYANFIAYAAISLISVLFCYFVLPETRGKTLIEIQNSLERQTPNTSSQNEDEEQLFDEQ
ncbi:facilitated trehalose transporter Tret1-like [Planococcus citri]|uniref:facilitated trehalose transporter Tret1-like n=1 Tax=Planococcus citri TaxID=170843 RepID=UPI0031F978CD